MACADAHSNFECGGADTERRGLAINPWLAVLTFQPSTHTSYSTAYFLRPLKSLQRLDRRDADLRKRDVVVQARTDVA